MFILSPLKTYFLNDKNLEANAKTIHTLKSTLNDDYLCRVANFNSAFVVGTHWPPFVNKSNIIWGVTRMMKVILPIYATWSKGITPLR